jgi:hypothetical protein
MTFLEERKARVAEMKKEANKMVRDLAELHWLIRDEEQFIALLERNNNA